MKTDAVGEFDEEKETSEGVNDALTVWRLTEAGFQEQVAE